MLCDEKMRRDILSRLKGYRYEHSLGVERCAVALAKKYGGDDDSAFINGVLGGLARSGLVAGGEADKLSDEDKQPVGDAP